MKEELQPFFEGGMATNRSKSTGEPVDEQQREFDNALSEAFDSYDPAKDNAATRARRRRISSRAIMSGLAAVAVILTVGGIAGPQITYALEASRYGEIADEANAHADKAQELESLLKSEQQLLSVRSKELQGQPSAMLDMSEDATEALDPKFKKSIAAAASSIRELRDDTTPSSGDTMLQKKALEARDLEQPDPQTWFAVAPETFATYADIQPKPVKHADTGTTVTLDMVRDTKELVKTNAALVADLQKQYDAEQQKNEELKAAVETAAKLVHDEAARAGKAGAEVISSREGDDAVTGRLPSEAEAAAREALAKSSSALSAAAAATVYAVDKDDKIFAVAEGKPLPDGTVVIPGGPAVQLAYTLPKLEAYVAAFNAEETAYNDEVTRLAAEEAARIAAEEEAARQAEEERQRQLEEEQKNNTEEPPPPTTDPTPSTEKPKPDCNDPENKELEECQTTEPTEFPGLNQFERTSSADGLWWLAR